MSRCLKLMGSFRPCRDCRDWNTCLLTDEEKYWFGYKDITFCKYHVFFLLRYEDDIRGRSWPIFGETLGGGSNRQLNDADWVSVSVILAELDTRLSKTGIKGELLRAQCKEPKRDRVEYLSDNAKDALFYVCGKRKSTSFTDWVRMRHFRYENRNIPQKVRR